MNARLSAQNETKHFKPVFLDTEKICLLNHAWKNFNMIYHSAYSDEYLWYLIWRGKQEDKQTQPKTKFLHIFQMVGTMTGDVSKT